MPPTRQVAQTLLPSQHSSTTTNVILCRPSTYQIAKGAYLAEGAGVFFRGLGICSARAFFVNAVQWAVSKLRSLPNADKLIRGKIYEWTMNLLAH